MAKIVNVFKIILGELIKKYGDGPKEPSEYVLKCASDLLPKIEDLYFSTNYHEEETLDISEDPESNFDDSEEFSNSQSSSQSWEQLHISNQAFSLEFMTKVLEYFDSIKTRKFEKTRRRYPSVKHATYISRFRTYVMKEGTNAAKLKELEASVVQRFLAARSNYLPVHVIDLQRWGMAEARALKLPFMASESWCKLFQTRNRIVSRKITKFVTKVNIRDREVIEAMSEEFLNNMKRKMSEFDKRQIFNTDQSGE